MNKKISRMISSVMAITFLVGNIGLTQQTFLRGEAAEKEKEYIVLGE